jgi:hypothetical protein
MGKVLMILLRYLLCVAIYMSFHLSFTICSGEKRSKCHKVYGTKKHERISIRKGNLSMASKSNFSRNTKIQYCSS